MHKQLCAHMKIGDFPSFDSQNFPHSTHIEIIVITVDLGDGRKDEISVKEYDEPCDLARDFCRKHNLSNKIQAALEREIEFQITLILQQETLQEHINPQASDSPLAGLEDSKHHETPEGNSYTEHLARPDTELCRLYYQGLKRRELTEKKNQVIRQQKRQTEMQQVTFKPKINSNHISRIGGPEQFLLSKWNERNEKLRDKVQEQLNEQLEECTFTPDISKTSFRTDAGQPVPRFIQLYENSKVKQAKLTQISRELLQQECPFNPDITLTSTINETLIRGSKGKTQVASAIEDPPEETFRPKIGRPPKHRESSPKAIGSRLYSMSFKQPLQEKRSGDFPKNFTAEKTNRIYNDMKNARFSELFEQLSLGDEQITPETIKKSNLPANTRKILSPLLEELADIEETLDYEEFCDSVEALLRTLSSVEKNSLLQKPRQRGHSAAPRTKPTRELSTGIYQRNLMRKQNTEHRVERERSSKLASERAQCTFHPKVTLYKARNTAKDTDFMCLVDLLKTDAI